MANTEYFGNTMKPGGSQFKRRAATGAEIQPASLIRANYGEAVLPHANREKN